MQYELDPFISPGEIAIIVPGLPIFFEETYDAAELAAQGYIALLSAPAAIGGAEPEDIPEPGDNPDIGSTPDTEGPSPMRCPQGYCPFCGERAHAKACGGLRFWLFDSALFAPSLIEGWGVAA